MNIFLQAKHAFLTWMNELSAADSALLGIIGFGLMIFSVSALLVQRHLESRPKSPHSDAHQIKSSLPLPGLRVGRPQERQRKFNASWLKAKQDPFLTRLERLN
ncbi:hypothetical protein EDD53_1626 [Pacificibacter maritimus]|uniref:Uncharacterized protein n=1 Tax=Pacificibacter maritimus TaxID=762213 RepID=A0A3N4UIR9_9RHOB|nr:hypothetical protein [Pacificibacter maritimus]RPE67221.1 hypothetical protein EDD53_1626 [Pacificibacter maritimus]